MPTMTIHYSTEAERLALERALAFVTQMRKVAIDAPHGTVLAACEQLALSQGRELLRDTLADAVQNCIEVKDAKKKTAASSPKGKGAAGS